MSERALDVLGCRAEVVSLDPTTLDEVIESIGAVGAATGAEERATAVMASLRTRVEDVRDAVARRPRPRVFALEWSDRRSTAGTGYPT